ncbi:MAG: paraquat-inducible protein A [Bradymonadales bacterium]|nr:paraquat-inducible protein A [Bradymonadales bacterium]
MSEEQNKRSLASLLPRRFEVPGLIGLAFAALVTAYALPIMVISKFIFFSDDYTLIGSVLGMWDEEYYFLAAVIFCFSIIFPMAKLSALLLIWYGRYEAKRRAKLLHWLGVLGKWSMLDVFIVAILVVFTQSKTLLGAEPRAGLYVFAGAIILSMVASMLVERHARRVDG